MTTKTHSRRGDVASLTTGATAARRFLLSEPVPLPPHLARGDYADCAVIYILAACMDLDVERLSLVVDLTRQDRVLGRQMQQLRAAFDATWPEDRQKADPEAYEDAYYTEFHPQTHQWLRERDALSVRMKERIAAYVVAQTITPGGVQDGRDPDSWGEWDVAVLDWIIGPGVALAKEQLTGKKSPSASDPSSPA